MKIYVADCDLVFINETDNIDGGTGFATSGAGSYEEVCGYIGLSEGEISLGWTIYPNLVKDVLSAFIHSGYDFDSEGSLDIFNALGQLVLSTTELATEMTLPVDDLTPGMYTVRITTGSAIEIKK